MRKAVYAGSFDPITNGHLWMVQEGARLFDELVIAIGENPDKKYSFPLEDRLRVLRDAVKGVAHVSVASFKDEFLVNYARSTGTQATAALAAMGLIGGARHRVESLILATRHDRPAATIDEQSIIDTDLAILGQSVDVFDRYEAGVRKEYSWLSDAEFWPKPAEFLKTLLARDHIFNTTRCQQRYEAPVRSNLHRSIDLCGRKTG